MFFTKNLTSIIPLAFVVVGLLGYNFMSAQWVGPTATAPGNNARAPINVGTSTQSLQDASGALVFNRFAAIDAVWSDQYCDAAGENCWDPSTGAPGGGDSDTITIGGKCFEPAWAVGCMWNWSGDGNDTSIYIRPTTASAASSCPSGRSYQYHSLILAECMRPVHAWVVGSYSCSVTAPSDCTTAYGTMNRTVVCRDQYGSTAADSLCPSPKPATRGASCSRTSTGSSCR